MNRQQLKRAAVVVYWLAVGAVVAYLLLRIWRHAEYSTVTRALFADCKRAALAIDDPARYHHVNTPCDRFVDRAVVSDGGTKELEYAVPVAINSLGFRNDEYDANKPKGVTRLIILGDSFVYGLGVRQDETFYKRLERKLNARGHRKYEVWNVAVVSWATLIQRRVAEGPLLQFSPDLVVLFLDDSDFYDNEVYRRQLGPDGRFPVKAVTPTSERDAEPLPLDSRFGEPASWHADMDAFWALREQVIKHAWDGEAGWPSFAVLRDRTAEHVEAIAGVLRGAHMPFLVVTYPYPRFPKDYESKNLLPLYQRFDTDGIAHASLYEVFPVETRARYYFGGNRHWNSEGSRRVADFLFERLQKDNPKLFPAGD